jgi:OFA family oxalate/formate antiporter-like MFS transporter
MKMMSGVRRYAILVASVLMQLALGGVYAWSTFVPALRVDHALSGTQAGLIFGTTIAVFTVTMLLAGRRLERIGPRRMAMAGGVCYGGGYLIAGLTSGEWTMLWLGIGLVSGVGIGMGYVCPLTTCVRWFPERKGFVTGLAVAGFGGGAIVLSEAAELLMASGWSPLQVFRAMGWTLAAVVVVCAQVLRFPLEAGGAFGAPLRTVALARDPHFRRLVVGMFAGTFGGLLAIGHLKPIALVAGLSSGAGALAVSAFAIGNAAGRLAWGSFHDRAGHRVIALSLGFLAFVLLGLLDSGVAWRFIAASLVAGFGFGSCFVVFAAEVASFYGVSQVSRIYPKIFLAYGVAGITGPLAGGWLYDVTGSYVWPVCTAAAITALGAIYVRRGARRLLETVAPAS